MTNDLPVRIATMQDEEEIMRMVPLIHKEIGRHRLNEDKVRQKVHRACARELAFIGVIGDPGEIRACLLLLVEPLWYSDDWELQELWNFVHPDHRRSDCGSRLVKWAKSVADEMSMDMFIGVFNNVRTEAKTRMYERLLPKAGAFFLYMPSGASPPPPEIAGN